MGYTHYWKQNREYTPAEWEELISHTLTIYRHSPVSLGNGMGEGAPEAGDTYIRFNGRADMDAEHEAFTLEIDGAGGFTKTGFSTIKRYDYIVKAMLIVAYNVAPDALDVASDGFDFEWEDALAFAQEMTEAHMVLPPDVANNTTLKDEYRSGELYEQARAEYKNRNKEDS